MRSLFARAARKSLVLGLAVLTGCRARELGAHVSNTRAPNVDATWVRVAKVCWPALETTSDHSVADSLADPINFRNAFGGYASLDDAVIERMAGASVLAAPPADPSALHATAMDVLTRVQALDGATKGLGSDRTALPPDAFCAIHSETPVGF